MPVILAFGKLRHEDLKLEVCLGYIERFCLKRPRRRKKIPEIFSHTKCT
jgi:hypothetical protein